MTTPIIPRVESDREKINDRGIVALGMVGLATGTWAQERRASPAGQPETQVGGHYDEQTGTKG